AVERRDEVVGHRADLALLAVPFLDEVDSALRGGIDRRFVDRVQRALRKRREGADGLDLVAEELDAERFASRRREEVDQAAADCELAALVDTFYAFVSGEREFLGERLDRDLTTCGERDRCGPCFARRQPFGDG